MRISFKFDIRYTFILTPSHTPNKVVLGRSWLQNVCEKINESFSQKINFFIYQNFYFLI